MPDLPEGGVDKVRSIVEALTGAGLADLVRAGCATQPDACLKSQDGWCILVAVFPTPTTLDLPSLTDCDRHCLALLAQCSEPLSAVRVRRELERRQVAIYGEVTVKRALARLHRLGVVTNSRRRPRGYALPDTLPLILRRLSG
jgi:hypothetical protein